jgi:hypothetical protein
MLKRKLRLQNLVAHVNRQLLGKKLRDLVKIMLKISELVELRVLVQRALL